MSGLLSQLDWRSYVVFAFAICLYLPSLTYDFTQDDAIVIYQNDYVRQGLSGFDNIFSSDSFSGFFSGKNNIDLVSGGRYRPLSIGLFALVYEIAGLTPWVYHLLAVLIYGLLCLLLFKMFTFVHTSWSQEFQVRFAFIAALLYAAHPIHTEAVANVKGMDEMLAFLFSICSFWACMKYIKDRKLLALLAASICLFLALLSKESAAPMVVIIPLFSFFLVPSDAKKYRHTMIGGLVCVVTFLGYIALRYSVVGIDVTDPPQEMMNNPFIKVIGGEYLSFTIEEKWATILYGIGQYIRLLFVPHPLTHDYYPRHIEVLSFSDLLVLLSGVMIISLIGLAILGLRKRSMISMMIFFFFATLFLTTNILFPVGTHLSERFLFMPSMGFVAIIALGVMQMYRQNRLSRLGYVVSGLLLLAYTTKTITRSTVWKDDFTLFTTDVKTSANSAKVRNAAGGALIAKAQEPSTTETDKHNFLRQAIEHLEVARHIHPRYVEPALLQANAHLLLGDYDDAINLYEQVLQFDPSKNSAFENLMLALKRGAQKAGGEQRDIDTAIRYLTKVLDYQPNDFEALALMGTAQGSKGQHSQAIIYYERAISVNPDIALTYVNLGVAQLNVGNEVSANENFRRALEIDPTALDKLNR